MHFSFNIKLHLIILRIVSLKNTSEDNTPSLRPKPLYILDMRPILHILQIECVILQIYKHYVHHINWLEQCFYLHAHWIMSATRNVTSGQHILPIIGQLPNVNCAASGSEIVTAEYLWFTVTPPVQTIHRNKKQRDKCYPWITINQVLTTNWHLTHSRSTLYLEPFGNGKRYVQRHNNAIQCRVRDRFICKFSINPDMRGISLKYKENIKMCFTQMSG